MSCKPLTKEEADALREMFWPKIIDDLNRDPGESGACIHGIRWPHECKECADTQVIPDGWCPICGGQSGEHKSGCQDGSEQP